MSLDGMSCGCTLSRSRPANRGVLRPLWSRLTLCLVALLPAVCAAQPGSVVSWGTYFGGQLNNLPPGQEYMAVCAGGYHSMALAANGSIVAWGENVNGQCNAPRDGKFTAIAAGLYHSLALRSDGSIVAWGDNTRGQCNAPQGRFLAIAAGNWHSLAVRDDGTLVAWGWNDHGQCNVPPGHDYIDVAGGYYHGLALKADRSIVAWGSNGDGQCNVPPGKDFVRIAAGSMHSVALRRDGTIVAWGRNSEGQCNVPLGNGFAAVAAGSLHSLALTQDGRIMAWGTNNHTQCDSPTGDKFAVIAAGSFHSLAIHDPRRISTRILPLREIEAPTADAAKAEPMLISDKIVPYGEQTVAAQTRSAYPPVEQVEPELSADRRGSLRDSRTSTPAESSQYVTPIAPRPGGDSRLTPPVRQIPPSTATEPITREPGRTQEPTVVPRTKPTPPVASTERRPEPKPVRPMVEQPRATDAVPAETSEPDEDLPEEVPESSPGDEQDPTPEAKVTPAPTRPSVSETPAKTPRIRLTLPPVIPEPRVKPNRSIPSKPEEITSATIDPNSTKTPATTRPTTPASAPASVPERTPGQPDTATEPNEPTAEEQSPSVAAAKPNTDFNLTDFFRQSIAADKYIGIDVNAVPVYHFTATSPARHFCTIDEKEKYDLIDHQRDKWKYQGIAFFAYPPASHPKDSVPVHRFWSASLDRHFYTMNEQERRLLVTKFADTWSYQGIAWYAPPIKSPEKK